ncbi:MAG: tRNA (N(6)-L-threonylcarbamoyladenosine(37)-C(2))-methylthiotransferase MtaB [Patescibacteria group bacterium]
MKKFKVITFGCKVNQYDSGILISRLVKKYGFEKIELGGEEEGDFVIINTCAVTRSAFNKSQKAIKKTRKENPGVKIFVTGCAVAVYRELLEQILDKDIKLSSVNHQHPRETLRELECFLNLANRKNQIKEKIALSDRSKNRYFLKIQDGCDQFCSYCIIPYARREKINKNPEDVIREIRKAEQAGYREVVLTGIHIGRYKSGQIKLENLLENILRETEIKRIRLSSIEVNEITPEIAGLIKQNSRICPHLHIPAQSGSDKILKLMNRPYRKKDFIQKVAFLKKEIPRICLTTDVVVGFPGEGDDDFEETREFCRKIGFSKIHVFTYSEHPKTAAAKLRSKNSKADKTARSRSLRELSDKLREEKLANFKDREMDLVVERLNRQEKTFVGKSRFSFDIKGDLQKIGGEKIRRGDLVKYSYQKGCDQIF